MLALDEPSSPHTLVFYAGDVGYMTPMLVSAASARANASRPNFDIWIFAVDFPAEALAAATRVAARHGVTVKPFSGDALRAFDPARFALDGDFKYITAATLARLAAIRAIPERYTRLIYLDGDTYCSGDLSDLADFPVAPDALYAAPDPMTQWRTYDSPLGEESRAYFAPLGIGEGDIYYNTGVLMADRESFADIADRSLAYFSANTAICEHLDQSAINVAAREAFRQISIRWNFETPYQMLGLQREIAPRVCHFTGREKPWRGRIRPWDALAVHYDTARADPDMSPFMPPLAAEDVRASLDRHQFLYALKAASTHRKRFARERAVVMGQESGAVV